MRKTLSDLYYGNLHPSELAVARGSAYEQLVNQQLKQADALCQQIGPQAAASYEALSNIDTQMSALAQEDSFICGFRLGARMMLEVFSDGDGNLHEIQS